MIIKGKAAGNSGWWGNHLESKENDRAEVVEIRGLLSENVPGALKEMEAIAAQSRSQGNFMYAASINPEKDERLTPEQWKTAVDTLEKNLGLEGHQRVVVEHEKDGRVHRHVMWNRVDADTLRVADIGGNYYTHERTARELEERLGLTPTKSLHGEHRPDGRPERAPELADIRAEERTGIDRKEMKAELTGIWRATDSGKAFAAALDERGYVVARGDSRDFVVVDHAGDAHSLARRLDGAKAAEVRERMEDVNRFSLPSVEEARARQRERHPTQEAAHAAWLDGNGYARENIAAAGAAARTEAQEQRDTRAGTPPEDRGYTVPPTHGMDDMAEDAGRGAIKVIGMAGAVMSKLADFATSLFTFGASPPPPSAAEQIQAQRRALGALENIARDLKHGDTVTADSINSLTTEHKMKIRDGGDAYLRGLIENSERDRERDRHDWGRTRER